MRRRVALVALVTAVCGLGVVAPARADLTDKERQESKLQYERATRLYDLGKYSEAIDAYQKAYEIGGDANMLYNIAQAYRLNEQPAEAARFYRRYLQRASNPRNREDVEKKIAEMDRLAETRKQGGAGVTTTPPPVTGGVATGTQPGATQPPAVTGTGAGAATTQSAAGGTPTTTGGTAQSPATGAVTPLTGVQPPLVNPGTTLPPPATGASTTAAPLVGTPGADISAPAASNADPLRTKRVVAYSLMGAGGGMLLVSMITGGAAVSKASQLTKDSNNGAAYDPKLQSSGQALNIVAVTTLLLALGLGGAGGYLYYTVREQEKAAAQPSSATVAPMVAPGVFGASGTFTF